MTEPADIPITSREFDARIGEIRRAVDLARESSGEGTQVELREYVEALLNEVRRATEIAERERSTAAIALRTEQRHAEDVAEREREKAAQALATALQQAIKEGDERLREHIQNQVEQINAALISIEKAAQLRHDANRTQLEDRFHYTERAVAKAERANEDRFKSVNEFREQLSDQAAHFLPREVADTQFAGLLRRIEVNGDALASMRTTFVTREAFDARLDELTKQVNRISETLGKLT